MGDGKYIDIYGQLKSKIVGGYVTDVRSVEGYDKDITDIKNLIDQLRILNISYNPNNKKFIILFKDGNKLECQIDTYTDILDLKSYKVKDVKYNGISISDTYGIVDLNKALINFVNTQLFKSLKDEVSVINSNIHKLKKVAYTGSYQDLNDSPIITDKLGGNSNYLISLKGITEAINNVDKVLPFDGFVDNVTISNQSNFYDGGKIYFVKSANRFAYYREQDGIYTAMWNGYTKYATFVQGQGVIPNSDRIFIYNNELYLYNGETLVKVGDSKDEIPEFSGIVSSASVLNSTGFNKNGEVYYIENPKIEDNIFVENGIFAYKVRNSYYRSWNNVYDYMNNDLLQPINNKLFSYNKQQYLYLDGEFGLLSNIGRLKWKEF